MSSSVQRVRRTSSPGTGDWRGRWFLAGWSTWACRSALAGGQGLATRRVHGNQSGSTCRSMTRRTSPCSSSRLPSGQWWSNGWSPALLASSSASPPTSGASSRSRCRCSRGTWWLRRGWVYFFQRHRIVPGNLLVFRLSGHQRQHLEHLQGPVLQAQLHRWHQAWHAVCLSEVWTEVV